MSSSHPFIPSLEKVYTPLISEEGKLSFSLSPNTKSSSSRVYAFFSQDSLMCYIGKTERTVSERMQEHLRKINDETLTGAQTRCYRVLREDKESIRFAVLEQKPQTPSLEEQEISLISQVPRHLRLNGNRGGGGGVSRSGSRAKKRSLAEKTDPSDPEVFSSPEKYYPIKKTAKGLTADISPDGKKTRDCVYVFHNKENHQRYIGTAKSFKKRVANHLSDAKSLNPNRYKSALHQALKTAGEDFEVGILGKDIACSEKRFEIERQMIDLKQSFTLGYNGNRGGGGSS